VGKNINLGSELEAELKGRMGSRIKGRMGGRINDGIGGRIKQTINLENNGAGIFVIGFK
jgi:hypothetical protein